MPSYASRFIRRFGQNVKTTLDAPVLRGTLNIVKKRFVKEGVLRARIA